jgi:hypothetical protein
MTATNSTEPAKDGNGNAFNITFAAESVSGNKAQKTYIGEPVGETIITPAQDGTDGTGIAAPTGAVGIRGWLSGIYSRLAGPLTVTGTFWQATQPISAASLPLPSGAAQDGTDGTGITAPTGAVGIRGWLSGIYSKLAGSISVTGTFWQATQPISAASLPLPSGAAQDGTDATGIAAPTGAVGIRGWLSGIYSRLAGPLTVTGTFWQATQPISAASLPLPTGAAQDGTDATGITQLAGGVGIRGWLSGIFSKLTSLIAALGTPMQATGGTVGLIAGTAAIGSIIGRTTMASATPVVTSNGAYAAGNEIGGLMTFPIGGAGSGTLLSVRVTSRSVLTTALKAYIFTTNPSNSTWTDKSATAINTADIASLLAIVTLNAPDNGLGTHTLWNAGAIGEQFVAANLYVVLVVVSAATLTSASVSDITVQLGVSDD